MSATDIDAELRAATGRAARKTRDVARTARTFSDPDTAPIVLMNLRGVLEQVAQSVEGVIEVLEQHVGHDLDPTTGQQHARTTWTALVAARSLARGARDQVAAATTQIGPTTWPAWRAQAPEPVRPASCTPMTLTPSTACAPSAPRFDGAVDDGLDPEPGEPGRSL